MKPRRLRKALLYSALALLLCFGLSDPALADEAASANTLQVSASDVVYTGAPHYPSTVVTCAGVTLKSGKDYTAAYRSNVNAGIASVTVSGKGAYKGKRGSCQFRIQRAPASELRVSGIKDSYAWTGNAIKPAPVVMLGSKTLKPGRDYTLSYAANKEPGAASLTISGNRNISGKKTVGFTIGKASITKANVGKIGSLYTTSLEQVKPRPLVTLNGKKLKLNTDYTLSYKDNQRPGTARVTIKGKGHYSGTITKKFKLVNMGDDLARAACKLSYSKGVHYSNGKYPGTSKYRKVYKQLGCPNASTNGRGCDAGMCTTIRWSGYDKSFPAGCGTPNSGINRYLGYTSGKGTSSKWKCLGSYKKGKTKLLPGDILFGKMANGNSHVCMYVGKSIAKSVYKQNLKGTDADLGSASGSYVSSHFSNPAALCICGGSWSLVDASFYKDRYKVYRCIKPSDKRYRAGKAVK